MSLLSLSDDEEYDSPSDRESLLPPSGTTTTTTTTNSGLPKRVKESENGHSASGGGRGLKPGGNGRREYQLINMAGDDSDDELLDIAERNEEESNNSHHGQVESERNGLDSSSHRPTDSSTRQRRRPLSRDHDVNKARKLSKSYYDDFVTIDWVRDSNRDRVRHKQLEVDRKLSWKGCGIKLWDALSGWFIVFLVGVSSGLFAGIIDVAAEWMSDLKEGFCLEVGYYNKDSCCWFSNKSIADSHCDGWKEWSDIVGVPRESVAGAYSFNYVIYVFLSVVLAGLAGFYVITLAPYASGSGIPEVKTILSGFIIRGYLGAWTLLVKSVGMVLAVGAGLSLGKEGPLVHVACCAGNLFTRIFPKYYRNEAKKREVLSAAAAAGVSVAFGAPVGGVLFSLEEVSYYFPHKVMWRAFFAALTAAFTLQLMNPYFSGRIVLFYANYNHQWHLFEFLPFALIGVFGGLYGAFFIWFNIKWAKLRRRFFSKFPFPVIEVIVVALITGLVQYPNPYTRTNASQVIRVLFSQCGPTDNSDLCKYNTTNLETTQQYHDTLALSEVWKAVWELLLAMLVKSILTIFTFGMKIPAGLFIPSMFVGACFGRVVGIVMEQIAFQAQDSGFFQLFCSQHEPCVTPGLYAMIGAAATLGGVTRMTVSLVVIMFELTGGLTYIVPIMIAVMISKWVGDALVKDGIYDGHIHLLGYPFLDSKEEFVHSTEACDVMHPRNNDPPLSVIDLSKVTVGSIQQLLKETEFFGFPCVLTASTQLLDGYITRKDLQYVVDSVYEMGGEEDLGEDTCVYFINSTRRINRPDGNSSNTPSVNFRGLMDPSPFQISDQTPMETVVEMFRKMGLRQCLVSHNGKLLGIITKKDVLRHIAQLEKKDPSAIRFH